MTADPWIHGLILCSQGDKPLPELSVCGLLDNTCMLGGTERACVWGAERNSCWLLEVYGSSRGGLMVCFIDVFSSVAG